MATHQKNGLRLEADFTEDAVALAIESYLTMADFPWGRFSLEPFSRQKERWLGADARMADEIKGFKPIYLQFKRPSAYPIQSNSKFVRERTALGLDVSQRTLFFGLRQKQASHWDYQHNILYRLRRRLKAKGLGDAVYVCPLFLERSAYRFHLKWAGMQVWSHLWRRDPMMPRSIEIHSDGKPFTFGHVPVLKEHVSIPPHAMVTSANHHYSFTEAGRDLCFHSPLALPEGSENLQSFLERVSSSFQLRDGFIRPENAYDELMTLFSQGNGEGDGPLLRRAAYSSQDGIGAWLQWGADLNVTFGIQQFMLFDWKE